MTKHPKKQPKSPEHILANKKLLQIFAVGVLAAVFGWFVLANPILNHLDKQRFLKAEQFIQEIYDNDIRTIAEPTTVVPLNSCRYTSVKLGEGTLFCATRINATYDNIDIEKLEKLIANIEEKVIDNVTRSAKEESRLSGIISYGEQLSCGVDLTPEPLEEESFNAKLVVSCNGEARTEHFPLEN